MNDIRCSGRIKRVYKIDQLESITINILKLLLIIGVVFIHSNGDLNLTVTTNMPTWVKWTKYISSSIIGRSAVPGYFLISGVLLFKKEFNWVSNIKKKIKTLVVPYFILTTLWIVLFYVAENISALAPIFQHSNQVISKWSFFDFANAYLGMKNGYPLLFPLWFLRDLLVLNLLSKIIEYLINYFPTVTLLVLSTLYFCNFELPVFFLATDSLFFFVLGGYITKYRLHFRDITSEASRFILFCYPIFIIIDCFTRGTFYHRIIHNLVLIVGLLFFMVLAKSLAASNVSETLERLSKYYIIVFFFHEFTLKFFTKITARILPSTPAFYVIQLIGNVFIISALCVIFGWLMKKFVPRIYALITGNR